MRPETVANYILRNFNLLSTDELTIETLPSEMFRWMPDVFFITSLIFKKTGVYIYILSPPRDKSFPTVREWEDSLAEKCEEWYSWIWENCEHFGDYARLAELIEDLNECLTDEIVSGITIDDLRNFSRIETMNDDDRYDACWKWCSVLFELHALADEICTGYGIPSGNYWTEEKSFDAPRKTIQYIASSLLTYKGSLSRFPTHLGVVLPKLRTPTVGMTVRSLSHYLTFHHSEVMIDWRTLPWVNIDENTVNILVVPYPYEVSATDFQPSPAVTNRANREDGRYFVYRGGKESFDIRILDKMLEEMESSVNRVHLIVFPEQALTETEHDEILLYLTKRYMQAQNGNPTHDRNNRNRQQMPMMLSGIRHAITEPLSADASTFADNKLVLSTFFAGKWYKTEQPKHHRWRLDRYQLRQYGLGGVLAGNRDWWEAIPYKQRKVSILAPNTWLALCPLICEDLARQEPVADVIRGIGPTLIIAILLDGPQLPQRWAARYASALADDPGSSVLTVTSLGMTRRSKQTKNHSDRKHDEPVNQDIGLWRDLQEGFESLAIDKDDKKRDSAGVLLNISAKWRDELTADGRKDSNSSALFIVDGQFQAGKTQVDDYEIMIEDDSYKDTLLEYAVRDGLLFSQENDLLEISLISYFVDAAFESIVSNEGMIVDKLDILSQWVLPADTTTPTEPRKLCPSMFRILAQHHSTLYADETTRKSEVTTYIKWFVQWMRECSERESIEPNDDYKSLLKEIQRLLHYIRHEPDTYFELVQGEHGEHSSDIPALNILLADFNNNWHIRARIPIYISFVYCP